MRYVFLSCAVATAAALSAGACGPSSPEAMSGAGGAGGAGGANEVGVSTPQTGLTHNEAPHNSLSPEALRFNASLRAKLATIPLSDSGLQDAVDNEVQGDPSQPSLRAQLSDPLTQDLMQYIVSCALEPPRTLSPPMGTSSVPQIPGERSSTPGDSDGWNSPGPWPGELGLCDEWATAAPTKACLERVSSCVLARVNALNKRVIISVRGPSGPDAGAGGSSGEPFPLQNKVPVETQYRERAPGSSTLPKPATPIRSFEDTCGEAQAGDSTRNCGWTPLYVARCTALQPVTIASACDDPGQGTMLRVCTGLYGCDDPMGMPTPAGGAPFYAGLLGQAPACTPVSFTCPNNGPLVDTSAGADPGGPRFGYFSVMAAPPDSLSPDAGVTTEPALSFTGSSVEYPALEEHVFTYREGAFYGDMFDTAAIAGKDLLPGDLFACYGDAWSCGLAHLTDRFCAGEGAFSCPSPDASTQVMQCFQTIPSPCFTVGGQLASGHVCQRDDGGPGDYYEECEGSGTGWAWPITVYLNHPCDLSPDGNCHGDAPLAAEVKPPLPNPSFGTDASCLPSPAETIGAIPSGGVPPYIYSWTVTILNTDQTVRAGPMTIGSQASVSTGSIPVNWWFTNLDMSTVQAAPGEPILFTFTVTDSAGTKATASETVDWQCVPP